MEFKDYYQTLDVERDATPDQIKRAYRKLARKYHPDVSEASDAEERFKEVQEAYEVLKDPEKRAAYDRFGQHWKNGQDFEPPPDWTGDFSFGGGGFTGADGFSEFFEALFGGPRGQPSGRGGFRQARMHGEDARARVAISIEDAYRGATRSITLGVPEYDEAGRVRNRSRVLNVKIPTGVTEGQRIRLAGQGGAGMGGAPSGDLYLEVAFEPHRLFRAQGRDIYVEVPVAPWEVGLGRTITVPTLGGRVDLKVPAGARSGSRLRLKGRGLPGNPPGDQFVVLNVVAPKAETPAAKELYERMERELAFDPRADLGERA